MDESEKLNDPLEQHKRFKQIDRARAAQRKERDDYWRNIIRQIHSDNEALSACQHQRTMTVRYEATEGRNGTALDAGEERRCRDCNAVLEVVS